MSPCGIGSGCTPVITFQIVLVLRCFQYKVGQRPIRFELKTFTIHFNSGPVISTVLPTLLKRARPVVMVGMTHQVQMGEPVVASRNYLEA